jgi:hypothetical protein
VKLVVIESPYAGDTALHIGYARRAMAHSLSLGEAPIASHLLYTQPGILDDEDPEQRKLGIACGLAWAQHAEVAAFYLDHGWSSGMRAAWQHYLETSEESLIVVEQRYLF